MKTRNDHPGGRGLSALLLPLLLAAGLLLGGCESDTTAPQDPDPAVTEQGAATQAGVVAMAVAEVGPEVLTFAEAAKNVYSRTYDSSFEGDIDGTVWLDFRLGGADGTPATYDAADWARLYTDDGDTMTVAIGAGGAVHLTFDVTADISEGRSSATLGGGGSFRTGVHEATFTFTALTVNATGDYPTGGTMTFTGSGFVMTVAFDGTNTAIVEVTGHGTWSLNLDTGDLTEIV